MALITPDSTATPGPWRHVNLHTRGIRLHAAVAGEPTDPLIVCLHSSFGGWFDFAPVLPVLADRGYCVAAVDMRGYGTSDKPPSGYTIRYAVGDIAGVIATLGHESAIVIGSGTGGAVAWALAATNPKLVHALISVSAAFPTDMRKACAKKPLQHTVPLLRAMTARLGTTLGSVVTRSVAQLVAVDLAATTHPGFTKVATYSRQVELRLIQAQLDHVPKVMMKNALLELARVPTKWMHKNVASPTLIIHDGTSTWRNIARLSLKRATGIVRERTISGTKNLPFMENPDAFVAVVTDFLHSLPKNDPS